MGLTWPPQVRIESEDWGMDKETGRTEVGDTKGPPSSVALNSKKRDREGKRRIREASSPLRLSLRRDPSRIRPGCLSASRGIIEGKDGSPLEGD